MSSKRRLSRTVSWTEAERELELLDWETQPEHFDRLCNAVFELFAQRDGRTREQLFQVLPEAELREQIRHIAPEFHERFVSLPGFIYTRLRSWTLPQAQRTKGQS
jgi:hypothetical protein